MLTLVASNTSLTALMSAMPGPEEVAGQAVMTGMLTYADVC
jgi:hypothetical protein